MLGLFELIILASIGVIILRLFWKKIAKAGSQPTPTAAQPETLSNITKTTTKPTSSLSDGLRTRPSSLPESDGESPAPVGVGWRPASGPLTTPESSIDKKRAEPPKAAPMLSKSKIVGYVRGLSQRTAQPNLQIYSFRVEAFDVQGNRLPPVTVEMKGIGFEGSLNEGDQVQINKKPKPGLTINIDRLNNITAGSPFKVQKYPLFVRILSIPMTLIGWILTAAFVIGFFWLLYSLIADLI